MQGRKKRDYVIRRVFSENVPAEKLLRYLYAIYLEEGKAAQCEKKGRI